MTQCSSRCWIDSSVSARSSPRRRPQPMSTASIAWSRNARGVAGGRGAGGAPARAAGPRATAGEPQVDGGRRILPLLEVYSVPEDDSAVERETWLGAVPPDELT